jgi:hypothetical protein
MWLFECKCGRGKKKIVPVEEVVDEVMEEAPVVVEKELNVIEEVVEESVEEESSDVHSIHEVAFGDDKEIDDRVVKRLGELLVPYLTKDSLKAIRVSYNEYVYLEESLSVSLTLEKLLEIVADLVKKNAVNKWVTHFDGLVHVFKKRSKLLRFKKNKGAVVKSSIIEYHLEKQEHTDDDKRLISIEEEFNRLPEVAK